MEGDSRVFDNSLAADAV